MPKSASSFPGVRARGDGIEIDLRYRGQRLRRILPLNPQVKSNFKRAADIRGKYRYEISIGQFDLKAAFPDSNAANRLGYTTTKVQTVEQLLLDLLDYPPKQIRKETLRSRRSLVTFHLIPGLGHLLITELSKQIILKWISTRRKERNLGNKTINNILTPLRTICAEQVKRGVIARDPMAEIDAFPVGIKEPDPFRSDEIKAILACAPVYLRSMIELWVATGLRTGEIFALQWSDIGPENESIFVTKRIDLESDDDETVSQTKTKASRRKVALMDQAKLALTALRNSANPEDPFLFRDQDDMLWESAKFGRMWATLLQEAGVRHRRPYNLRHTYASNMLSAHAPIAWLRQQMGHATLRLIETTYAKYLDEVDPSVCERIQSALDGTGTKK